MTLVPDFDISTIKVSEPDDLHHLVSSAVRRTYTYRAERSRPAKPSGGGGAPDKLSQGATKSGVCAILFFVPGKRLTSPAFAGEKDPAFWDWAWPWRYHKMGFEYQDQVEKVVVSALHVNASNESLREDAVDVGEQMMGVLDRAISDYSCDTYRIYIHATAYGGLIVRSLMTMDDRVWTENHLADDVARFLLDFHRTLNSSLFVLESTVFVGVPHSGPRRTLGLKSRVLSLFSRWFLKAASYVVDGLSDALLEFMHEDAERVFCQLAAAEAQQNYEFDPVVGSSRGSLLRRFGVVATYGLLNGDAIAAARSSLGIFNDFSESKAALLVRATPALQNRPLRLSLEDAPLNKLLRESPEDPLIRRLLTSKDICQTTTTPAETYALTLQLLQITGRATAKSAAEYPARATLAEELHRVNKESSGVDRYVVLLSQEGAESTQVSSKGNMQALFPEFLRAKPAFQEPDWLLGKQHALLSHVVHNVLFLPLNDSSPVDRWWWQAPTAQ
ncbi:hypothetical protein BESB_063390 [Besnoitia besnoiti]|uniref:Uncharacterized protein n=1 Tax=Besnoitia besnoiti TaxID=94643 RepID=A0A2A9MJ95_BESBE|nr:hypothetical protein BESB_063390 [Besnoitia besnoiti]PFH35452.1 hypothetical protein BESB_063390 [Besnoitia besnoiti]